MSLQNQNIQIDICEKDNKCTKIHEDPEVYTIDDVLSIDECQHFINISKDNMKQSLVSKNDKGGLSSGRTSSNTWLPHNHDPITFAIAQKIAKIVDMPLENAESYQVVHYNVTQEYRQHFDSWEHNYSDKTLRCMKMGGARLKTALVYLNDVEEGGGTKMTKLKREIKSKQGKLLVFNNTYKDSHIRHPLSEHAGMPVSKGEKYIFNLWFRECKRDRLYADFNPEYYSKMNKLLVEPPVSPTQLIPIQPPNTPDEKMIVETRIAETMIDETMIDETMIDETIIILDEVKEKLEQHVDEKIEQQVEKKLIHSQFHLEEGDYFPFVKITYVAGGQKEMHNFVDDHDFAIIHVKNIEQIKTIKRHPKMNTIILFKEGSPTSEIKNISSNDAQLYQLFKENEKKITVYLLTPNRKIYKSYEIDSIDDYNNTPIEKRIITGSNIPILVIENVLSPELTKKILAYYDNNANKQIAHNTGTKNRLHVHPCKNLEIEIDNKLSRSVFPEIRKIFYFDVNYRENYKICSYNAETSGRFHAHRDTPYPFQHRRFAMSLLLNDDYEGGEFELPEYNFKIKPKANSAIIFPGISTHKVNQVTKGSRKVIITFYCSEIEGKTKDNSQYSVKSHFFKQHDIQYGPIYPK